MAKDTDNDWFKYLQLDKDGLRKARRKHGRPQPEETRELRSAADVLKRFYRDGEEGGS